MSYPYDLKSIATFLAPSYRGRTFGLLPYGYNLTFTSFAQNANSSQQLNIQANADFLLLAVKYHAHISAVQTVSTKTVAFARLLITDNGSGQQFTNSAIDLENYANNGANSSGTGQIPYPRLIGGRSSLTVQLVGYQPTAETYGVIDLYFEGVNVQVFK